MLDFVLKTLMAVMLVAAIGLSDSHADETAVIAGLRMGADQVSVQDLLQQLCDSVTVVNHDEVTFPLASETETHLVCDGYSGAPIAFDKAAFVIADGGLVWMQALNIDIDSANAVLGEPDGEYLRMNNYHDGTIWLDTRNRNLYWLSMEARHPNLFAWSNPNLGNEAVGGENNSTKIPALLDFSASLDELRPLFEAQCQQIVVHENERVWLPHKPETQVQIDCFGVPFAGFERKFEAVFGDGKLEVIWVLTGKPEEDRLREYLTRDWGNPTLVNDSWEIFGDGRISLYKDKPEFLILSDDMIPLYQEEFESH